MKFTSLTYIYFLVLIVGMYWLINKKHFQNILLLAGSYFFYGYIHPWFCYLLVTTTLVDYFCGRAIHTSITNKRLFLILSLSINLGILGVFKYFNFFLDNFYSAVATLGITVSPYTLNILLPIGISFYTFRSLSYTIDIYRGEINPRKNLIDYALFVAFFPELMAGPIERAKKLLPQIEQHRKWRWEYLLTATSLFLRGYLKKLVIADNIAVYTNKIFILDSPSFFILAVGSLAFAIQIYADFSAYTDIARGSGKLLGFELTENFNSPYLAISPSDFWRRWHISLSTWIRDYIYIPFGGSRVGSKLKFLFVLLSSMGLCGLWHGAAWNFILWGLYYGALIFIYHSLGLGGKWKPKGLTTQIPAWLIMTSFTLFGWLLFRSPDLCWLGRSLWNFSGGFQGDSFTISIITLTMIIFYSLPFFVLFITDRLIPQNAYFQAILNGILLIGIILLYQSSQQDFIYFQF
jgi:alginate O-acetyltransferase complex protein AlgI